MKKSKLVFLGLLTYTTITAQNKIKKNTQYFLNDLKKINAPTKQFEYYKDLVENHELRKEVKLKISNISEKTIDELLINEPTNNLEPLGALIKECSTDNKYFVNQISNGKNKFEIKSNSLHIKGTLNLIYSDKTNPIKKIIYAANIAKEIDLWITKMWFNSENIVFINYFVDKKDSLNFKLNVYGKINSPFAKNDTVSISNKSLKKITQEVAFFVRDLKMNDMKKKHNFNTHQRKKYTNNKHYKQIKQP